MMKKMLAVALMASSVLVLAGCNKTPTEPEVVITPNMEEITGDEEVMSVNVDEETMPVENDAIEAQEEAPVAVAQPVEETEVVAAE